MNKIKAYIDMDEVNKVHFYKEFQIEKDVPAVDELLDGEIIKEVFPVRLDYEQGNDEVYGYDYYKVFITQNGEYDFDNDVYCERWVAVEKFSWYDFCIEHEDKIKECLREMIQNTYAYDQDLYFYKDGTIDVFVNVGGNSWLNDDHVCFYKMRQYFYVDALEQEGFGTENADDEAILDCFVDDEFEVLLNKVQYEEVN